MEDILATDDFALTLLEGELHVGRVAPDALQSCAWPLLKSIFEADEKDGNFFSLTQDGGELTLVLDERCRAAFDAAASVATVEFAPHRWRCTHSSKL